MEKKFALEILIYYLLNTPLEGLDYYSDFCEQLINQINILYNDNLIFYYNNQIFNQYYPYPSTGKILYDKNNREEIAKLCQLWDFDNKFSEKQKNLIFEIIYSNYYIIKLSKIFLKIYFEKKSNKTIKVVNLMKEIIQNQLNFYKAPNKSSGSTTKGMSGSDSLTKSEDVKDDSFSKPLLNINKLTRVMHFSLKKYLLKTLKNCLEIELSQNEDLKSNKKNQESLIEVLNSLMNLSLILISCDESWEIKLIGVQLLINTITVKFS